ncbi:MAG TPA: hypothetical protein VKQ30_22465 [Ktedonobacterales bacterium]|nr:hypothetical protein [Ktedonobacterales bacterium]
MLSSEPTHSAVNPAPVLSDTIGIVGSFILAFLGGSHLALAAAPREWQTRASLSRWTLTL